MTTHRKPASSCTKPKTAARAFSAGLKTKLSGSGRYRLRLIQAVPSPKAEPIKLWLAKVGYERIQEMADPALSLDRAREMWQKHGRSDKWIQQRMTGQETRNKLTDYWAEHDIKKGDEYAILTVSKPTKI